MSSFKELPPPIYTLCLIVTTLCKPVIQTVAVWFSLHDVWHLSKDTETWKPNVAETPESNELEEANPQFPLLGPLELSLFSTLSQPCEFSYSFLNHSVLYNKEFGWFLSSGQFPGDRRIMIIRGGTLESHEFTLMRWLWMGAGHQKAQLGDERTGALSQVVSAQPLGKKRGLAIEFNHGVNQSGLSYRKSNKNEAGQWRLVELRVCTEDWCARRVIRPDSMGRRHRSSAFRTLQDLAT